MSGSCNVNSQSYVYKVIQAFVIHRRILISRDSDSPQKRFQGNLVSESQFSVSSVFIVIMSYSNICVSVQQLFPGNQTKG